MAAPKTEKKNDVSIPEDKHTNASSESNNKRILQNGKSEKNEKKRQVCMYLGPNLPGGKLSKGSVFKQIPEHLSEIFEKVPEIKTFFVEIKNLPDFNKELQQSGSEIHRKYQNLSKLLNDFVKERKQ